MCINLHKNELFFKTQQETCCVFFVSNNDDSVFKIHITISFTSYLPIGALFCSSEYQYYICSNSLLSKDLVTSLQYGGQQLRPILFTISLSESTTCWQQLTSIYKWYWQILSEITKQCNGYLICTIVIDFPRLRKIL